MTEYRRFALWARTFAAFVALAGLLGLGGCGGGSGAPNNVFNNPGVLSIQPSPLTVYAGTPATVTIAGGERPFEVFSSDATALPVINVSGNTVTVLPNNVATATAVTLTVRDALGNTATSAVTVQPGAFINALKLKADSYSATCPNPTGSANPTDEVVSTFICSGQTGSLAVRLASVLGGGISGRLVRFDIVQGAFQIFTELPGQTPTFALSYTVPTDVNGQAVVRIRAVPGASHQTAIVQATDVATGAFVRGTFVIVSTNIANVADLVVIPDTVTITGADNQTCSSGVPSTFFIFGGAPPYRVVASFPDTVLISPSVVLTSGAGFTVTTLGACVDPLTITIVDSAGHTTTVTLTNEPGTNPPASFTESVPLNFSPSSIATPIACGTSVSLTAIGGGTITRQGNTVTTTPATLTWSTSRPDVVSVIPSSGDSGVAVTLTRVVPPTPTDVPAGSTVVNQVTPPLNVFVPPPGPGPGIGGNATVTVTVSDGTQIKTLTVPVANTCTSLPTPP